MRRGPYFLAPFFSSLRRGSVFLCFFFFSFPVPVGLELKKGVGWKYFGGLFAFGWYVETKSHSVWVMVSVYSAIAVGES